MIVTENLGIVTAYAEAVRAGFTGTKDEFAAMLRRAAEDENIVVFDTVTDMKSSADLRSGMICKTNGFRTVGDGGGAVYTLTDSTTANEMDIIACGDLYAELVTNGTTINIRQIGAYGDGTNDDYSYFVRAIEMIYEMSPLSIPFRDNPKGGGTVYIPNGDYKVDTALTRSNLTSNISFVGEARENTYIYPPDNGFCRLLGGSTWNVNFNNLTFYGNTGLVIQGAHSCCFSNLRFINASSKTGITLYLTAGVVIEKCFFSGLQAGLSVSGNTGTGPSTSLDVHDCWFNHSTYAVLLQFSRNGLMTTSIHDSIMEYCTYGVHSTGSETYVTEIEVRNIHFEMNDYAIYATNSSIKFENLIQSTQEDYDKLYFKPASYNKIIGIHSTAAISSRFNIVNANNNVTIKGQDGTLMDYIGCKRIIHGRTASFSSTMAPTKAYFHVKYTSSNGMCICTGNFVRGESSQIDDGRIGSLSASISNTGSFQVYEQADPSDQRLEITWSAV